MVFGASRITPPALFHTPRLRLRRPVMADAPAIFHGYAQDPDVVRYVTWRPHVELATVEAFLARCLKQWEEGTEFTWAIQPADGPAAIGAIGMRIKDHRADLGYVLAKPYWGRGFMSEAVGALVAWALAQPTIFRAWAICDVENVASARVMEKAGMQREGVLRRQIVHPNRSAEPRDCYVYSIVK